MAHVFFVSGMIEAWGRGFDKIKTASEPIRTFTGTVIAVLHRLNDCEDKWIVSTDGSGPDRDGILQAIAFQEQYYMGELYEGR